MKVVKGVMIVITMGYIGIFVSSFIWKDCYWDYATLYLSIFALTFGIEDFINRFLKYRTIKNEIDKKDISCINDLDCEVKNNLLKEVLGQNKNGNKKILVALLMSIAVFGIIQCLLGDILKTSDRMTMLSAILVVSSLTMNIFMRIKADKIINHDKEEK